MMELKMRGYPRPNIKWTKDGKPIEAGDRFKFVNPDPETCALIISKVTSNLSILEIIGSICMYVVSTTEIGFLRWKRPTKASTKLC